MVILKTLEQIEGIRKSCKLVAEVLTILSKEVKPGVTTIYLDKLAEEFAYDNQALPAFKGYKDFPYSLCTSINSEVVHGLPSLRTLQDGDILSMDYGIKLNSYYGDSAVTVSVGNISEKIKRFIKTGQECLYFGIKQIYSGNRLNRISHIINSYARAKNYNVVKQYGGHGIGLELHEPPFVPNFTKKPNEGLLMQPGLILAVEPMITLGSNRLTVDSKNKWTVYTNDNSLAIHWEHTVLVGLDGPEVLTLRSDEDFYGKAGIK